MPVARGLARLAWTSMVQPRRPAGSAPAGAAGRPDCASLPVASTLPPGRSGSPRHLGVRDQAAGAEASPGLTSTSAPSLPGRRRSRSPPPGRRGRTRDHSPKAIRPTETTSLIVPLMTVPSICDSRVYTCQPVQVERRAGGDVQRVNVRAAPRPGASHQLLHLVHQLDVCVIRQRGRAIVKVPLEPGQIIAQVLAHHLQELRRRGRPGPSNVTEAKPDRTGPYPAWCQ